METLLRYRGRAVTRDDVHQIRELVAAHPEQSRRALSETLCSAWDWRQANGATRSMVCRGLMLALWRAGHIELPAVRRRPPNPLCVRARPAPDDGGQHAAAGIVARVGAAHVRAGAAHGRESHFNSLMQAHHYLGYAQPVGEHLKFMVYAGSRPIALFAWSSAPRHLGPRDRFLGWSPEVRRQNIAGIAYNTRFLILPWVEVEHLASHLLGRMTRVLSEEWQQPMGTRCILPRPSSIAAAIAGRATGRRTGSTWVKLRGAARMI
jgi:hypothetical protein